MPSDHGCGGAEPTKYRLLEKVQEPLGWLAAKDRPMNTAAQPRWKPLQQHQTWNSRQHQRSNYRHQYEVIDHVDGKQLMIKRGERRANDDP
jgi:hypothetical protein